MHPVYYLGGSTLGIIIMDIDNKTVIKQLSFEKSIALLGWVSLYEIMYRQGTKVFVYNLNTNSTHLLKCECHKYLVRSTFSSDFSRLIFTKAEDSLQSNNRIFEDSKLVQMKKDGSNEQEILP
jgi:hypothetical protein